MHLASIYVLKYYYTNLIENVEPEVLGYEGKPQKRSLDDSQVHGR